MELLVFSRFLNTGFMFYYTKGRSQSTRFILFTLYYFLKIWCLPAD